VPEIQCASEIYFFTQRSGPLDAAVQTSVVPSPAVADLPSRSFLQNLPATGAAAGAPEGAGAALGVAFGVAGAGAGAGAGVVVVVVGVGAANAVGTEPPTNNAAPTATASTSCFIALPPVPNKSASCRTGSAMYPTCYLVTNRFRLSMRWAFAVNLV
jgi:hypothetical protein